MQVILLFFLAAVRDNPKCVSATDSDIKIKLASWLQHAPEKYKAVILIICLVLIYPVSVYCVNFKHGIINKNYRRPKNRTRRIGEIS